MGEMRAMAPTTGVRADSPPCAVPVTSSLNQAYRRAHPFRQLAQAEIFDLIEEGAMAELLQLGGVGTVARRLLERTEDEVAFECS